MTELLKELMSSGDFAEIYTDSSDISKFAFGRIVACDELFFIAELISPSGNYDGTAYANKSDVTQVSCNSENEISLLKLYNYNKLRRT